MLKQLKVATILEMCSAVCFGFYFSLAGPVLPALGEVLFEDGFYEGRGSWAVVCRTDASVAFNLSSHCADLTVSPVNGQPVSMWHSFPRIELEDGEWIEAAAKVRLHSSNTNAALRDIRLALAYDNDAALLGTTSSLAIPYSGYYVTASSCFPGTSGRINWVDGESVPKNFFNSMDGQISCSSVNATVSDPYRTLTFRLRRAGSNLVFTAALDGESYGEYSVADASFGSLQDRFVFNAVGVAYAYQLGQTLFCDEITVHCGGTRTFTVDEYIEPADGSDTGPAIRRAVADAQAYAELSPEHFSVVSFSPDETYYLGERIAVNPQIELYQAERVTLSGNNALLVSYINNNHFSLWRCTDVVIENFRLDLSPLPFTQGAVIGIHKADGKFDLQIDEGFSNPPIGYYLAGAGAQDAPFFNADGSHNQNWINVDRVTQPSGFASNVFRVFAVSNDIPKLESVFSGNRCVLKTITDYPITNLVARRVFTPDGELISNGAGNIELRKCDGVTVRNVTSYSSRAQTVHAFGCRKLIFDSFDFYPKPGSGRLMASNKGGLILRSTLGSVTITNCWFESAADDLMAASDNILQMATLLATNRIEIIDESYPMEHATGWNLLILDPQTPALKATARISNVEKLSGSRFRLTLDQMVFKAGDSALSASDWFYVERLHPVRLVNSVLVNSMKKGVISRGPMEISGCLFSNLNYGVHHYFEGAAANGEGPFAYGLSAVSNSFCDILTGGIVLWTAGETFFNCHQTNRVEHNEFIQREAGHGIQMVRMNGVQILNNQFWFSPDLDSTWRAVSYRTCTNLVINGNSGDRL